MRRDKTAQDPEARRRIWAEQLEQKTGRPWSAVEHEVRERLEYFDRLARYDHKAYDAWGHFEVAVAGLERVAYTDPEGEDADVAADIKKLAERAAERANRDDWAAPQGIEVPLPVSTRNMDRIRGFLRQFSRPELLRAVRRDREGEPWSMFPEAIHLPEKPSNTYRKEKLSRVKLIAAFAEWPSLVLSLVSLLFGNRDNEAGSAEELLERERETIDPTRRRKTRNAKQARTDWK